MNAIVELTRGYENKADYFVDRLSLGLARIAAALYPKPVIIRMSDFKTNEYAGLIGGAEFEPRRKIRCSAFWRLALLLVRDIGMVSHWNAARSGV